MLVTLCASQLEPSIPGFLFRGLLKFTPQKICYVFSSARCEHKKCWGRGKRGDMVRRHARVHTKGHAAL